MTTRTISPERVEELIERFLKYEDGHLERTHNHATDAEIAVGFYLAESEQLAAALRARAEKLHEQGKIRTSQLALMTEERDCLRAALEAIISASDRCVGHRDCNHSMKPWQDARAILSASPTEKEEK